MFWCLCGLLFLAVPGVTAQTTRQIHVVMDDNYPPYVFRDEAGQLRGILVDEWRLWEQKTGITVRLEAMEWNEALQLMQSGQAEVIDTIFNTPERRTWLDFTPCYAQIDVAIFFDHRISGITDLKSLQGFAVGVKSGDNAVLQLKAAGVTNLHLYPNYESIVQAAAEHKVNVFIIDEPCAYYYLNKLQIQDQFNVSAPVNRGQFSRGVKKGNLALLREVTDGFAAITPEERATIRKKWMGSTLAWTPQNYRHLGYAMGGITLLVLLLLGSNWMLRKQVDRRTKLLQHSEASLEAERNFASAVVDNAGVIVVVLDREGRICRLNHTAERISGYLREELLGSLIWATGLLAPNESDKIRQAAFAALWEQGGPDANAIQYTNHWTSRTGERRLIEWFNTLLKDTDGRVEFLVSVGIDITEKKDLEEQFLRSQRMEAMGSLVAGIAHDLNNIFTPVLLITTLLRRSVHEAEDLKLLQMLEQNTQRGANIIRQLVTFSRGASGVRTVISSSKPLEEIAALVRETFPREIQFVVQIPGDLPNLRADPTQLHQVLLNLCVNARDAMPRGGQLTLAARQVTLGAAELQRHAPAQPGPYVEWEVSDTGCGIPEKNIPRIFEPFFSTKSRGKGTGLGLSTSSGIVRGHGGFIAVQSNPDAGTTMRVYLPVAPDQTVTEEKEASIATATKAGGKILVVDDEPMVSTTIQLLLEQDNYQVITAENGEVALQKLQSEGAVDLVLTDLVMPIMNGTDLIRELRRKHPSIAVIASTGMASESMQAELSALGVTRILSKPVTPEVLLAAVESELQAAKG